MPQVQQPLDLKTLSPSVQLRTAGGPGATGATGEQGEQGDPASVSVYYYNDDLGNTNVDGTEDTIINTTLDLADIDTGDIFEILISGFLNGTETDTKKLHLFFAGQGFFNPAITMTGTDGGYLLRVTGMRSGLNGIKYFATLQIENGSADIANHYGIIGGVDFSTPVSLIVKVSDEGTGASSNNVQINFAKAYKLR